MRIAMSLPKKTNPIARPSIREEVYSKLLAWIMEGVLSPGEKIVDKELALHLGVSRTPVREALCRLEDKGLVESAANRWTRISPIPPEEPEMIHPIVHALEQLALSAAAGAMTNQDFSEMLQANTRLEAAIENRNSLEAARADHELHSVFIRRSGNIHLIDLLELAEKEGPYSEIRAYQDIQLLDAVTLDHMKELSFYDKKAIHNLKYFTWVEQQGRDARELDRQWTDHDIYWEGIFGKEKELDDLITDFNDRVGQI